MNRLDHRFWYCAAVALTAVELDAIRSNRNESTLSFALRKVLRTDCRTGRCALRVGFIALGFWLIPHLETQADNLSAYLEDAAA